MNTFDRIAAEQVATVSPGVFAQSEREATVLRSFNLPIRSNARSGVFSLLFTRSTLTMWRLAPKSLVDPMLRSAAVGVAVTVILRVTNIGDLASWLLFFLLLLQGRRLGLTRHLRLDRERVFMGQLRQKLQAAGESAEIIQTELGIGYRLLAVSDD